MKQITTNDYKRINAKIKEYVESYCLGYLSEERSTEYEDEIEIGDDVLRFEFRVTCTCDDCKSATYFEEAKSDLRFSVEILSACLYEDYDEIAVELGDDIKDEYRY